MNKELFHNTKIKVTPEQSERVQKLAFDNGIQWNGGAQFIKHTDSNYLFFGGSIMAYSDSDSQFSSNTYREIFMSDLFPEEEKPVDTKDLSKWSVADLKAAKDFCSEVGKIHSSGAQVKKWARASFEYHEELLKRLQP